MTSTQLVRSAAGRLRRRILGIADEEATAARRGFRGGDGEVRRHLDAIGRAFLHGYHASLEDDRPDRLSRRLAETEPGLLGFAFEGAGMALYLLDLLTPWERGRFAGFLAGDGSAHAYMVHVGAGWAMAQLRLRVDRALARLDPLLGWLAVDGYGFHHGYFRWPEAVDRHRVPRRLAGYARRAFDQGLGRSLWFVEGAEVARIAATIARVPDGSARRPLGRRRAGLCLRGRRARRGDRGPGRGGRPVPARRGPGHGLRRQGPRARRQPDPAHRAGLPARLRDVPAVEAAALTDRALIGLTDGDDRPAYEVWRGRIRANWNEEAVTR